MKNKKKHHINTFAAVDGVLLFVLSLICLLPIINVLAISFSFARRCRCRTRCAVAG